MEFVPYLKEEKLEEYKTWVRRLELDGESDEAVGHIITILQEYMYKSVYVCTNMSEAEVLQNRREALQKIVETVVAWKDKEYYRYVYLITMAQSKLFMGDIQGAEEYYAEILQLPEVVEPVICEDFYRGEFGCAVTVAHNLANLYDYDGKVKLAEECRSQYRWMLETEKWYEGRDKTGDPKTDDFIRQELKKRGEFCNSNVIYIDVNSGESFVMYHDEEYRPLPDLMNWEDVNLAEIQEGVLSLGREFLMEDGTWIWTRYMDIPQILKNADMLKREIIRGRYGDPGLRISGRPESTPYHRLDHLTGLQSIKHDVNSMVNLVRVQERKKRMGLKTVPMSLHLVFSGNPGTGKTTVARILAEIYKEIGILSKGHLVEVDRAGLVAGYVGQTAIKTQKKIRQAMGGVLFIDEAYTLVREEDDYGQEAIDTILKAMEDQRDDLIVIVAGYSDRMKKFINSNPGLKSRFNKYIDFPDYSAEELVDIFYTMCDEYEYLVSINAQEVMKKYIYQMEADKDDNFANAREVRNLFERVITNQATRVTNDPTAHIQEITEEDFQ